MIEQFITELMNNAGYIFHLFKKNKSAVNIYDWVKGDLE